MLRVLTSSWALFLGICLLMIGNSLQGTLLGVRGKIEGFDPTVMGYVMTCYFAGFFGGSLMTPSMIRRVGYVRVFAALGSLISAAFIIYVAWISPIAWGVMRFIVGFCFSGVYVVAESWLNNSATNDNRGQTLSAYSMVQMFGVVTGQLLVNAADPGGYSLFILMSVVVSVSFAPILLSASPAPLSDNTSPMSLRELLEASPLGCIGSFLLGGIFAAIFGMGAVYGGEVGLSVEQISLFMTLMYAPALIAQYPIGWLSDKIDRRRLIVGCTAIATLACALGTYAVGGDIIIYITAAILGAVVNPLYSLLIAYTNDYLPPEKMAGASSGLVFMNGLGAAGGPIAVGYFMRWFGPNGFFIFMGILSFVISVYALYRMTRRAAPAPTETGTFVQLPTRGAVMVEVASEIYAEEAADAETSTEEDGTGKNAATAPQPAYQQRHQSHQGANDMTTPQEVLDFWLERVGPQGWWIASDAVDDECRALFSEATVEAAEGALDGWAATPDGALALLILLDQFPRNLYRETPRAFASDPKAREIARKAIIANLDLETAEPGRMFFYMPFEHSESIADQDWSLALFDGRMPDLPEATHHHVVQHREVILRFGRFPHRNAVLGRESTAEEIAFLTGDDAYIPGKTAAD